ncbi:MAG: PrsW family intramembrane metalloprotease [Bacteroidetes bacterium]|nr:MAG: PrsW family intramembrane metalloprotease [Bacteroidota bacterium]
MPVVHFSVSLLPVVLFLSGLILIDSYKLVRPKFVASALLMGALAAGIGYFLNNGIIDATGMSYGAYARTIGPLVEESLKATFVIYAIRSNKVGFAVDAAIAGFAVGAGFAVVENVYFLNAMPDASLKIWVIRGLGTAVMHGGTMTVFALIAKTMGDRKDASWGVFLPALFGAVVLHMFYNTFFLRQPLLGTGAMIVILPLLVATLFRESEKRTRNWLGSGFDTDQELLKSILSGDIRDTRVGMYLQALKERFDGSTVVDMLCLIRIRVELSIRAKGVLMMREAGFKIQPDPKTKLKFKELVYLEEAIGKTGLVAIEPIHNWTRRDLWQLNLIEEP